MTKSCIPNPNPNNNKNDMKNIKSSTFSNNIFSNILTTSLYLSYFIFFFPYLFNLISFLFPLFITISLLLLSLTTSLIPLNSKHGTLLDNSHSNFDNDDKLLAMDEFEFYKFVFDVPAIEPTEANPFENVEFKENPDENFCQLDEKRVDDQCGSKSFTVKQETGESKVGKKKQDGTTTVKRSESNEVKNTPKFVSLRDNKLQKNLLMSNFGSMRKEKDQWRGTLACMLFEERHNNGNGDDEEGMDLLWETQETEINKKKDNLQEFEEKKKKKKLQRRSSSSNKTEHLIMKSEYRNDEDEDESEESDDYYDHGKLCCLQGLKLSAGKMNLTMGKPNLVKISKVFKGIGWLHSHLRKLDKKGYK